MPAAERQKTRSPVLAWPSDVPLQRGDTYGEGDDLALEIPATAFPATYPGPDASESDRAFPISSRFAGSGHIHIAMPKADPGGRQSRKGSVLKRECECP